MQQQTQNNQDEESKKVPIILVVAIILLIIAGIINEGHKFESNVLMIIVAIIFIKLGISHGTKQ